MRISPFENAEAYGIYRCDDNTSNRRATYDKGFLAEAS